jgi:hypothetical protein
MRQPKLAHNCASSWLPIEPNMTDMLPHHSPLDQAQLIRPYMTPCCTKHEESANWSPHFELNRCGGQRGCWGKQGGRSGGGGIPRGGNRRWGGGGGADWLPLRAGRRGRGRRAKSDRNRRLRPASGGTVCRILSPCVCHLKLICLTLSLSVPISSHVSQFDEILPILIRP